MAQVFISYAREDRLWAEALAKVFQRRQWSVWWDRELVVGQPFPDEIERELEAAACVVVLWSANAIASPWVKTEAAEGAARNVLVPMFIEQIRLPLEFRRLHTGDLSRWDRETETAEVLSCVKAVRSLVERQAPQAALAQGASASPGTRSPEVLPPQPAARSRWRRRPAMLAFVAVLVAIGLSFPYLWPGEAANHTTLVTDTETAATTDTSTTKEQPTQTDTASTQPTDPTPPIETPPQSPVSGMIGAGFSPRGFVEYVKLQKFTWRPEFIVVHHTSAPALAEWKRMSGEQRMDQMAKVFTDRGLRGGPHVFVDDTQIWVLNPLTKPGIHAASWNKTSIGVEIVGDYSKEPFEGRLRDNTISAIATLSAALGLNPSSIRFHSEEPRQRGRSACPGSNVLKDDLIRRVQQDLARRRAT